MDLFEEIRKIICEKLKRKPEEVNLETSFFNDLKMDSLDTIQLIKALEEKYGVKIPAEDMEYINTVKDLVKYIESRVSIDEARG